MLREISFTETSRPCSAFEAAACDLRNARAKVESMYDARFFRMWEYYLSGGIVMFENGTGCNYQVQYIRDREAVPITRDYIAKAEARYRQTAKQAPAK